MHSLNVGYHGSYSEKTVHGIMVMHGGSVNLVWMVNGVGSQQNWFQSKGSIPGNVGKYAWELVQAASILRIFFIKKKVPNV